MSESMVSMKVKSRSRGLSPFIAEILEAVKNSPYVYFSHKAWLESLGERAETMSAGSLNNGPRYNLRAHKLVCIAGTASGEELEAIAEAEGRELTEDDIVYSATKAVVK